MDLYATWPDPLNTYFLDARTNGPLYRVSTHARCFVLVADAEPNLKSAVRDSILLNLLFLTGWIARSYLECNT